MHRKMLTMLCSQGVHTDREVIANRPGRTVKNRKDKTCILIDVAVSADRNVQKEDEKKLKYRSIEIQRTWNMKCKNIQ
jgi:hypothetical protein